MLHAITLLGVIILFFANEALAQGATKLTFVSSTPEFCASKCQTAGYHIAWDIGGQCLFV
jgi:hypothetical protein